MMFGTAALNRLTSFGVGIGRTDNGFSSVSLKALIRGSGSTQVMLWLAEMF
jgi:hypothetical protein